MKPVTHLVPIDDLDRAILTLDDGEFSERVNNPPRGGFSTDAENFVSEPPPPAFRH